MSVLFSAQAPTRTSTSSSPRAAASAPYAVSSRSTPPCPVSTTARIRAGTLASVVIVSSPPWSCQAPCHHTRVELLRLHCEPHNPLPCALGEHLNRRPSRYWSSCGTSADADPAHPACARTPPPFSRRLSSPATRSQTTSITHLRSSPTGTVHQPPGGSSGRETDPRAQRQQSGDPRSPRTALFYGLSRTRVSTTSPRAPHSHPHGEAIKIVSVHSSGSKERARRQRGFPSIRHALSGEQQSARSGTRRHSPSGSSPTASRSAAAVIAHVRPELVPSSRCQSASSEGLRIWAHTGICDRPGALTRRRRRFSALLAPGISTPST